MARSREVYYYDHPPADFGLSGLADRLCARATLRLDGPTVLALASAAAEDEDDQLGRDVRLLLDSPLPDEVLGAVWLAAVRRCFDPAEEGTEPRAWLRRVAEVCPPRTSERNPYEVASLDAVRPTVPEGELRTTVSAEIEAAAAGLESSVAVPGIVPALLRVVHEADADLGFRLFLRAAKAYSVPVAKDQYDRLVAIGDLLAYPGVVVHEELHVRWPPIDPGRRDLGSGQFGLPHLAAVLNGSDWQLRGTVRENTESAVRADVGQTPGTQAAVLLEDAQRLLASALSGADVTAVWRAAAARSWYTGEDEFDADGRAWLEQVAQVCRKHLTEVDPVYRPVVSPARTDLTETVLREVREAARADAIEKRGGARALEDVVTTVDPDLGFRILLQILSTYDIPVTDAQNIRYGAIAEQLGISADELADWLPRRLH
ncbi:hypothetical protein ACFWBF_28530 [Streptomyces sp. NPDC060028]|uniref:hypothetical protein n=1 Tax=Streptomyces sp. NPDC060028 TaxID=3347041 RepID=UPI00368F473B